MTLGAELKKLVGDLEIPEVERERAALLAVEYADLTARSLAGEDVSAELRHVRAQADGIVAANAISVGAVLREGILGALTKTIVALAI